MTGGNQQLGKIHLAPTSIVDCDMLQMDKSETRLGTQVLCVRKDLDHTCNKQPPKLTAHMQKRFY